MGNKILSRLKAYLKLARLRHWIKNTIVAIPAFFGGRLLEENTAPSILLAFTVFSLCSSSVYVINDICDVERDRLHPTKRDRPLASGAVSLVEGYILLVLFTASALMLSIYLCGFSIDLAIPVIYILLNLLYSKLFKNKPIADIVILVSGFFLRLLWGASVADVRISSWLYLTVVALSIFLAFGKRRNEKLTCSDTARPVLARYSDRYLNSSMYTYLALFLVFYSLWSTDPSTAAGMIYTTPLVAVMMMRYTYSLESGGHGNPVDMILSDRPLLAMGGLYGVCVFLIIYFPEVLP